MGCKIYDAMTKRPVTAKPEYSIKKCAEIMRDKDVGSLLILEGEECKGMITEFDIVRKVVAQGVDVKTPVIEVMSTSLISVHSDQDIYEAAIIMRNNNIRHVLVMDKGKFMGFLTSKDVLKIQPQLFELLVEKYELREETDKPVFKYYDKDGVCELCGEYTIKTYNVNGSNVCLDCKKGMNDQD